MALWRTDFNNNLIEQIFKHFSLEIVARPVGGICIVRAKIDPFAKNVMGNLQ